MANSLAAQASIVHGSMAGSWMLNLDNVSLNAGRQLLKVHGIVQRRCNLQVFSAWYSTEKM